MGGRKGKSVRVERGGCASACALGLPADVGEPNGVCGS